MVELFQRKTPLHTVYILLLIASCCVESVDSRRSRWFGPSSINSSRLNKNNLQFTILRGGSTTTQSNNIDDDEIVKERAYRLQQQLYLQTRSIQLREALIDRGFVELQHFDNGVQRAKDIDWDCLLSTEEHPKDCLYTLHAEQGTKVMCPMDDSKKYITVAALNRLRRTDPSKVNPLWHDQYNVLKCWFGEGSEYSVYQHLPQAFAVGVSGLLDRPRLLQSVFGMLLLLSLIVTLPMWRIVGPQLLQTPLLWQTWSHWGRFAHAALPFKLLMVQIAFYYASAAAKMVYGEIHDLLVEWECNMLEKHLPLTIIEEQDENEEDTP